MATLKKFLFVFVVSKTRRRCVEENPRSPPEEKKITLREKRSTAPCPLRFKDLKKPKLFRLKPIINFARDFPKTRQRAKFTLKILVYLQFVLKG